MLYCRWNLSGLYPLHSLATTSLHTKTTKNPQISVSIHYIFGYEIIVVIIIIIIIIIIMGSLELFLTSSHVIMWGITLVNDCGENSVQDVPTGAQDVSWSCSWLPCKHVDCWPQPEYPLIIIIIIIIIIIFSYPRFYKGLKKIIIFTTEGTKIIITIIHFCNRLAAVTSLYQKFL